VGAALKITRKEMNEILGHITAVEGSRITVKPETDYLDESSIDIETIIKVRQQDRAIIAVVTAVHCDSGSLSERKLVADLLGELVPSGENGPKFRRGLSRAPKSGAPVFLASADDLMVIFAQPSRPSIRVGSLYHDAAQPAFVLINELLSKHFAVFGTTGSGKSCAITLLLSALVSECPMAHVLLIDPHNEYSRVFGKLAEVVNVDNLQLPFWLFDFEEAVGILVRGGTAQEQEAQAIILKDAMIRARRRYAGENHSAASLTVDTPTPFRISDLVRFIDEGMGKLDKPDTSTPYLRLKMRLESLRDDRRFGFMFSDWLVNQASLSEIVGRLLRIPVAEKPLTVMDLSGVPSEVADVIVSLVCRLTFDFAVWSERARMPVLLVCEEAHRYVPADERIGFPAAARAITRIAREGRKYGIALGLISQRPSELSPQALSQCGTTFALRLAHEVDQRFMETVLQDGARSNLAALASLGTQEAVICGEGVTLPVRIRFDDLARTRRPRSEGADFAKAWQTDAADVHFRDEGVRRWRQQSRKRVPV
jgi:DNA helicase HerA-like ATPase